MTRLINIAVTVLAALLLVAVEDRCSTFLGDQELQATVTPVAGQSGHFTVAFHDVVGNTLSADAADLATVTARLGGDKVHGIDAVPLTSAPALAGDGITVDLAPDAQESALRDRLTAKPFRRTNPPVPMFHLSPGIDLRGGVEFICRLHREDGAVVPATDEIVAILRQRLDERGLTEPAVSRLSNGDVQVVIPGGSSADAARTRKVLETTGKLEFRRVLFPTGKDPDPQDNSRANYAVDADPDDPDSAVIRAKGGWDFNPKHPENHRERGEIVLPHHVNPGETPKLFYRLGRPELVGGDIKDAQPTVYMGQNDLELTFTAVGAAKNSQFTTSIKQDGLPNGSSQRAGSGRLAICFDNEVREVLWVKEPSSVTCLIEGAFSNEEIDNLQKVLRGGSLDVVPVVLSERVVGATLGEQTVNRSVTTMLISYAAIVIFMIAYYRILGVVAVICLAFTTFYIWAILAIFGATVTLPGLAGLVLTIGMAVDTNILIFERIREELREDKGLKAAIEAGYARAWATIIDAHLTTFFTAMILYFVGSGPVKGFGLTLMIGIVVNLFSGVYVGRLLTDWFCRKKATVHMAAWIPVLKLPYVEWRWAGYLFSIVTGVLALGWFCFGHLVVGGTFERNFDIDFTGGNAVQVVFKQPMSLDQVESAITTAHAADPQGLALLDPKELRKQPYFAHLGAGNSASREWAFRGRDEEGGTIEAHRAQLEEERAQLERKVADLPADQGPRDPVFKQLQKDMKVKDDEIHDLTVQIASRTEAFKGQLAKAFTGSVGAEGDEIISAAWTPQSASAADAVALHLETLEAPTHDQLTDIESRLTGHVPGMTDIVVTSTGENLDLSATVTGLPSGRETDAGDHIAARLTKLLGGDGSAATVLTGRVARAEDLYLAAVDAAAARRVTVAKPFPSSEHFSGQVAGQMKWSALEAIGLSLLIILAYVAARFEFRFGIGAVVALFHDVLLTVGLISVLGIRIDLTVVAALLTIIGYSINDTIVTFDRIRENLRKLAFDLPTVIDISIAQTMPRSVLTSSTVILTVLMLFLFGGDALHAFTATLLIGLISGTYSSIFVAPPLLLTFGGRMVEPPKPADPAGGPPGIGDPVPGVVGQPPAPTA